MAKATSYICEHTAEYTLVPTLKNILRRKFESVTPIFPWITREGGNTSFRLHGHEKFKILGLYPRRPKLNPANYENIIVKVNEQILFGAKSGLEYGIPIIAGCPIASDFWELGKDPNCLWINLESISMEKFEIELELDNSSYSITKFPECAFQSEEDILTYIDDIAETTDLITALEAIKTIKMQSKGIEFYYSMAFMGGYKPVYFLLK